MRDLDVRAAVRRRLDSVHAYDPSTIVIEEMGIWAGTVRVDVAVINGEMHGVELKSERDTLDRLSDQERLYSEVFDRVTLVAAKKHVAKATERIPNWWGLIAASTDPSGKVILEDLREANLNPTIAPLQIARLFWRSEALDVLERFGLARGFRSKTAEIIAQRTAAVLPLNVLRDEVRAALKHRQIAVSDLRVNHTEVPVQTVAYPGGPAARSCG